jgi:hypothetical protein
MATSSTAVMQGSRPQAVTLAVALTVVNVSFGVISMAVFPDIEDFATVLTVSIVLGALMLAAAWFLWRGARWGAIAAIAVNAFNILIGLPAYFTGQTASFIIAATVSMVLSAGTIAFIYSQSARRFWGAQREPAAT